MWSATVHSRPGSPFLTFLSRSGESNTWSYRQFDQIVELTAGRLHRLGVGKGDAVHLNLRNSPAFIMCLLACSRLGAWIVSTDPGSAARQISEQISRTQPRVGVVGVDRRSAYHTGVALSDLPNLTVIEVSEDEPDTLAGSPLYFDGRTAGRRAAAEVVPEDRLAVVFTPGADERQRAVVLTQGNYARTARLAAKLAELRPEHRWFITLPLFHPHSQLRSLASAVVRGASVVLAGEFSASTWQAQARRTEVTHAALFAAPMRMVLARSPAGAQPLTLEHVWLTAGVDAEQSGRFARLVGTTPQAVFGTPETCSLITCGDGAIGDALGRPIPGRPAYLADPESREPVPAGTIGSIAMTGRRGVELFAGYLDEPLATAERFFDFDGRSWFDTGILARELPAGSWQRITSSDRIVQVSGVDVSLPEVAARIEGMPSVATAVVAAVPHDIRDHELEVFVVPSRADDAPTCAELTAWAEVNLAPAARPARWRVVPESPRTPAPLGSEQSPTRL
nr:AMP-binding protein [Brevibacterium daeguense]